MADYSASDKLACVRRELKMRKEVYGRRVSEGRMRPETAQREIGIMQAIEHDYADAANKELLL